MKQKHASFIISEEERGILENVTMLEPFLQDNLGKMRKVKGGYRIKLDAEGLFDALSAVEYAGKCMVTHLQRPAYGRLFQKLKTHLYLIGEKGQQLGR